MNCCRPAVPRSTRLPAPRPIRRRPTIIAQEVPYYIISYQGYQMFYAKDLPVTVEATPRGNLRGLIGMPG